MPRIKAGKVSLYYKIRGKGYPVLLIAGLNADHASWIGVYEKLSGNFEVILFDNRGSGRSSTPKQKYSIREMADDAIGLINHLRVKKCHVIGHSMGGYIAQELAINYPERVGKLILEATAPVTSSRNNLLFKDLCQRFKKSRNKEALMRAWTCWLFSPKTLERKNYIAAFIRKASAYPYFQSAAGFKGQTEAIAMFNASIRLKKIKAKTLVMIGSDDMLFSPVESMKLIKGIKGSVLAEVKGAGHCLHVEYPDLFVSRAVKFLK